MSKRTAGGAHADSSPRFYLIAAFALNRVIGNNNQLPWHLPEDLRYFKEVTLGKTVIMGRATFDSIGKPLPQRRNVVVSRSLSLARAKPTDYEVVSSLDAAFNHCRHDQEVFVIGGAQIFASALPRVERLYLTEIKIPFPGDCFFPPLDLQDWNPISRQPQVSKDGIPFDLAVYQRRAASDNPRLLQRQESTQRNRLNTLAYQVFKDRQLDLFAGA